MQGGNSGFSAYEEIKKPKGKKFIKIYEVIGIEFHIIDPACFELLFSSDLRYNSKNKQLVNKAWKQIKQTWKKSQKNI